MAEKKAKKTENKKDNKAKEPVKASNASASVQEGSTIKLHYKGTLDDGTVFDSSERLGEPLEFTVGAKQVIRGFDAAVRGMKKGDEKNIKLQPNEAYGDPNPDLVKEVPIEHLPKQPSPAVGMMLMISLPNGVQLPAKITKVTKEAATIDLNHPLSGKVLNFWLKIVEIA